MTSTPAPDSYTNPDSPWRWVPVVAGPLAFVAMGVAFDNKSGSVANIAGWTVLATLFVLLIVSRFKFATGVIPRGTRANSHPALATTMLVAGAAMVVTWLVLRIVIDHDLSERSTIENALRSSGFFMPGVMLALNGWYRPWDLKVVEPETRADEVTA